jgi:hypothetical protein
VPNRRSIEKPVERGVSRVGIIGFALLVGVVGFVVLSSMQIGATTCEVCMEFQGRSKCRTVGAKTTDEARRGAVDNACAFISGGVTDRMACSREIPVSEKCW